MSEHRSPVPITNACIHLLSLTTFSGFIDKFSRPFGLVSGCGTIRGNVLDLDNLLPDFLNSLKRFGEEGDFRGLLIIPVVIEMVEGRCGVLLGVRELNELDRRARFVRPISSSSMADIQLSYLLLGKPQRSTRQKCNATHDDRCGFIWHRKRPCCDKLYVFGEPLVAHLSPLPLSLPTTSHTKTLTVIIKHSVHNPHHYVHRGRGSRELSRNARR